MSPVEKKLKVDDEYELIYWPIPGRGEFIRLCFEHAGAAYKDTPGGIDEVMKYISGEIDFGKNPLPLAPPILKHKDVILAQTPVILQYLAPRLNLTYDDEIRRLHVHQLALTGLDFNNEAHDTHHPVGVGLYYEDQKVEAKRYAEQFRKERMPKFLEYFDENLNKNDESNHKFLVGDRITYADYVLFQLIDGLKFAFPKRMKTLLSTYNHLRNFYDNVKSHPNIKAYLESGRRLKYSDGVFRHYDELDDE